MITARISASGRHLAARLAERAQLLAEAHAENRRLARRGDGSRWRRAGLLWPLFTKDR
jgi:hypothetical protein